MHLNLHIDHITLDGITLPRSQRSDLQASVAAELSRLFTTHGIPPALQKGGKIPHLPTELTLTDHPNPTHLGQQIAQNIYTQLQEQNRPHG